MPNTLWLLLVCVVLVVIGQFVTVELLRMLFYLLALVVAIAAVMRLTGVM